MKYINKMDLFGFKSFADETTIYFNEGITAIVGPNGAGKSNIVEAFQWILGEQSASKLRVDRAMGQESLIFRGTSERKPLSFTEVSLTLNNFELSSGKRWLGGDCEEVAVKRKLYRDGRSECYINEAPVRLKDVHELFLGTGLGRTSYSIIPQLKVVEIAKHTPDERRVVIEEAAGISKYIEKRKEAVRKLDDSERQLDSVRATIREVEKRFKTLKDQADRAERFHKYEDERKKHRIDLYLYYLSKNKETEKHIAVEIRAIGEEKTALEREIAELDDQKKQELFKFESTRVEIANLEKQDHETFTEITALGRQMQSAVGYRANMHHDLDDAKKRKELFERRRDEYSDQIGLYEKESASLKDSVASAMTEQEQHYAKVEEEKTSIAACRARIDEIDEAIRRHNERLSGSRANQKELIDAIINEIDEKKKDVERLTVYQNRDKLERDIEIGFGNILDSLKHKLARINEFEELNALSELSEANYNRLVDFVTAMKEKLDTEIRDAHFLKDIFLEYNQIKDPFIDLLFDKEGTYRRKEDIDAEIAAIEFDIQKANAEIETVQKTIALSQETIERVNDRNARLSVEVAQMQERLRGVERSRQSVLSAREETLRELELSAAKIEKLENAVRSLDKEIEISQARHDDLREKKNAVEREKDEKARALKHAEDALKGAETGSAKKAKKLEEINTRVARLEERFINARENVEKIYRDFYEDHSTNLKDFEAQFDAERFDEEKTKARLQKLGERIKSLGHINEMAIDEFYETKERLEFLTEQRKDLEVAKEELMKIIDEANKEALTHFKKTFSEINENFKTIFKELFGGGKAELALVDPNNMLETGVDIVALPPGANEKKMQSVVSFSGGQLTMIGIALVFAIFKCSPSPFCVLDEADAALDAANIVRFKNLIREFSARTQFLIITHQANTATVADTFYGVTQVEDGVTKLYAVHVNEDGTIDSERKVHLERA